MAALPLSSHSLAYSGAEARDEDEDGGGGDLGCEEQAHKQISSNPMPPPFPRFTTNITTTPPSSQTKTKTRPGLG